MGDLKYISGMYSDKANDFHNISWWYGGEHQEVLFVYNALAKDLTKLECYEQIKQNLDEDTVKAEAKIEVLINKDGIVREICFILCESNLKYGTELWNYHVIGNKKLNIDKAIGHSLLSYKEFVRVKELGLESHNALKEYFNWDSQGCSEWKTLPIGN